MHISGEPSMELDHTLPTTPSKQYSHVSFRAGVQGKSTFVYQYTTTNYCTCQMHCTIKRLGFSAAPPSITWAYWDVKRGVWIRDIVGRVWYSREYNSKSVYYCKWYILVNFHFLSLTAFHQRFPSCRYPRAHITRSPTSTNQRNLQRPHRFMGNGLHQGETSWTRS